MTAARTVAEAQHRLDDAVEAETQARRRWETAASTLATAERHASGNPTYHQLAHCWDSESTTYQTVVDPDTRTHLVHLAEKEAEARAARDRAGRAVVAARQQLAHAQRVAQLEWIEASS